MTAGQTNGNKPTRLNGLLYEMAAHILHQLYTCHRHDGLPAMRWPEHLPFLASDELVQAINQVMYSYDREKLFFVRC